MPALGSRRAGNKNGRRWFADYRVCDKHQTLGSNPTGSFSDICMEVMVECAHRRQFKPFDGVDAIYCPNIDMLTSCKADDAFLFVT